MAQEHLDGLFLLTIESDVKSSLNFDSVVETFAEKRARMKSL